jgi:hypothetical protein
MIAQARTKDGKSIDPLEETRFSLQYKVLCL